MIRRLFRQVGSIAVLSFLWQHRGSVVRTTDLARRLPQLVTGGQRDEAITEAKAILALDDRVPTSTDIRITRIREGSVLLRGDADAATFDVARQALLGVSDVLDVRTDGGAQPIVDDALAAT